MRAGSVRAAVLGRPNGPSLDLNFAMGRVDPRLVFTRASSATYFDATGTLQTAAANVPRIDWGASPGPTPLGLLIEEQRTNLLLQSGAPATQSVTLTATGSYVLWLVGTGSAAIAAGTAVGTGWGTATAGAPVVVNVTTAGTVTVTVSGSPTRFQLEAGAFATSYIPTTTAAATRAADAASVPCGAWFNPSAGSLAMAWDSTSTASPTIGGLSDGTFGNSLYFSTAYVTALVNGSGGVTSMGSSPVYNGSVNKEACSYSNSGLYATIGALTPGYSSIGSPSPYPWKSLLGLGVQPWFVGETTGLLNGHMRRVRFWPRALSSAELMQVTT